MDEVSRKRYLKLIEAKQLGYGSVPTLRRDIREGRLPAFRIGRNVVVRPEDLEARVTPVEPSMSA